MPFLAVFTIVAIVVVAMWPVVAWKLSRLGGWSRLAKHYQDGIERTGVRRGWQSAVVGGVNYNNCLTFVVCDEGLQLCVFLPFRFGHPPLLIPWQDIYNARVVKELLFQEWLVVEVGQPVVSTLKLPLWLESHILERSA